jgi:hypothetical protein
VSATAGRAVYTALMGNHEELPDQPVAASSAVPFICLTDDPDLRSDTWDVRLVPSLLALDPIRSARALKITGDPSLAEYSETLWIDARVRLEEDPDVILDTWLDGADLALPRHSFRKDVVTEFEEVLLAGLDDSNRLYEQLVHYSTVAPDQLQAPVPWTGMLARRRTPEVERAMAEWLLHVVRYTRRDQLSFVHAVALAGVEPTTIEIDTYESPVHTWLRGQGRSTRPATFRVSESLQPPVARLGELQRQLEQTSLEMVAAVAAREKQIAQLEEQVGRLAADGDRLRRQLQQVRGQLGKARERVQRLRTARQRAELGAERARRAADAARAAAPRRGLVRRVGSRVRRLARPAGPGR